MDEILKCDYSNESFSAVLFCGAVCFSVRYKINFDDISIFLASISLILGVGFSQRQINSDSIFYTWLRAGLLLHYNTIQFISYSQCRAGFFVVVFFRTKANLLQKLILIHKVIFLTGDPRCADITLQNRRLNSREAKVVALPHLSALTDPANLLKW